MTTYGGPEWNYNTFSFDEGPKSCTLKNADIEHPITVSQFIDGALRDTTSARKNEFSSTSAAMCLRLVAWAQ